MSTKYQIFVSSTFVDLKPEREQVIKAILEMGHIPVGMEMFSAADEEQWQIIARQIEVCDYYVVLVAHRYGSVTTEGLSYTEKEYDYAVAQKVPVLGFVLTDATPWPADADHRESDPGRQSALAAFKHKVKGRPVGFWSSKEELHGKVSIALMKAIQIHPRPGWVRRTGEVGAEVLTELARLSTENNALRSELEQVRAEQKNEREAEIRRVLEVMGNIRQPSYFKRASKAGFEEGKTLSLLRVFDLSASSLLAGCRLNRLRWLVGMESSEDVSILDTENPSPINTLMDDLMKLYSLSLVEPFGEELDPETQTWRLTPFGKEVSAWRYRSKMIREKVVG